MRRVLIDDDDAVRRLRHDIGFVQLRARDAKRQVGGRRFHWHFFHARGIGRRGAAREERRLKIPRGVRHLRRDRERAHIVGISALIGRALRTE